MSSLLMSSGFGTCGLLSNLRSFATPADVFPMWMFNSLPTILRKSTASLMNSSLFSLMPFASFIKAILTRSSLTLQPNVGAFILYVSSGSEPASIDSRFHENVQSLGIDEIYELLSLVIENLFHFNHKSSHPAKAS